MGIGPIRPTRRHTAIFAALRLIRDSFAVRERLVLKTWRRKAQQWSERDRAAGCRHFTADSGAC
jgi:hypothetical protein